MNSSIKCVLLRIPYSSSVNNYGVFTLFVLKGDCANYDHSRAVWLHGTDWH